MASRQDSWIRSWTLGLLLTTVLRIAGAAPRDAANDAGGTAFVGGRPSLGDQQAENATAEGSLASEETAAATEATFAIGQTHHLRFERRGTSAASTVEDVWAVVEGRPFEAGSANRNFVVLQQAVRLEESWRQRKACVDAERRFSSGLQRYVTPTSYRQLPFVPRPAGNCGFSAHCGRTVVDGALDVKHLRAADRLKDDGAGIQEWSGLGVVRGLLETAFDVTGVRLTPVGGQRGGNDLAVAPCWLHSDFLARPGMYYFTAIVYLSDQRPGGCGTCETVFVDRVDAASGQVARGVAVQPRRGRVLLFSSGVENMHCKVPHSGDRRVLVVYFRCDEAGGADL